ncbi:hypothetical protein GCM10009592_15060 [Brachybacterium rhamnosum]
MRLARLMRCPIVRSSTKKHCAIWAVVSPPTARSMSATCEAVVSAGCAQSISSRRVSSGASDSTGSAGSDARPGSRAAARSSRSRRAASARRRSTARREATRVSQAAGFLGVPSRGHCSAAAMSASWTASSQVVKSP